MSGSYLSRLGLRPSEWLLDKVECGEHSGTGIVSLAPVLVSGPTSLYPRVPEDRLSSPRTLVFSLDHLLSTLGTADPSFFLATPI